jgi:hypothetical protein
VRVVADPERRPCYACGERADVAVGRGHRTWYACWTHADAILERGGVIVAGDVRDRELDRKRRRGRPGSGSTE